MFRKIVAVWVSLAMLFGFIVILDVVTDFTPTVKATTLYVNETGSGGVYTSIQDAINDSTDGDTVFVYAGIYIESISISKTINLTGEDKATTTIDGGGTGNVVWVNADWVNITGFAIKGSGSRWDAGLKLNHVQNCKIYDNNIISNEYGIYLDLGSNNVITGNNISLNDENGIYIWHSDENNFTNNNISNSTRGFNIDRSTGNNINSNNITTNGIGVYLWDSSGNNITENNFLNNDNGVYATYYSESNNISSNNFYSWGSGVVLRSSSSWNNVTDNNITSLYYGISIYENYGNNITGNTMLNCSIFIEKGDLEHWNSHVIDITNTINGKPVFYWKNQIGGTIPPEAGQVILANCTNIEIQNLELTNCSVGIELGYSTNNSISNNIVSNNVKGIWLYNSHGNSITDNNASLNDYEGIRLDYSNENDIIHNNAILNIDGIYLASSDFNIIMENVINLNQDDGIDIGSSKNNNVTGNNISLNYRGILLNYCTLTNVSRNIVYSNNHYGIYIASVSKNNIHNNDVINCQFGIYLYNSAEQYITNNTMINNGIFIESENLASWNTHNIDATNTINGKIVYYMRNLIGGTILPDAGQIILANCSYFTIENQELTYGSVGILLGFSSHINISYNNISSNNAYGIYLQSSGVNNLKANTVSSNSDCNIILRDSDMNYLLDNIVSNSKNGISLTYYSRKNTITNNSIFSNSNYGVYQYHFSSSNTIRGNSINNNEYGIYLLQSSQNEIYGNTISSNNNYGLYLSSSSDDNIIYHNNIIGNANPAYGSGGSNNWDSGYPIGGNYWSDYTGVDEYSGPNQNQSESDGIGDTPFVIGPFAQDDYPLIEPFVMDDSPPIIALISPSNNSIIKPGLAINISISDRYLDEVTFSINGDPDQVFAPPFEINTTDWGDGTYIVEIYAVDIYSNANTTEYNFSIDSIPPSISLISPIWISLNDDPIIKAGISINLSISDMHLSEVYILINNDSWALLPSPYEINTIYWDDGNYSIIINASDISGNFNLAWINFSVDATLPEVTLNSPHNNSVLLDASTIDFIVSDDNLKSVSYSVDQGIILNLNVPYDIDTTYWDDGLHTVTIRAEDKGGNIVEPYFTFRVDTLPPSIISHYMSNELSNINGDAYIIIQFSESMDIESVESATSISPYAVYIISWSNDNKTLKIHFPEPLKYGSSYRITISNGAKDLAGRSLDNPYEIEFRTIDEGFPLVYLLIPLLLIIVAIILIVLMIKRKRSLQANPKYQQSMVQISCPDCGHSFQVVEINKPIHVECPNCGLIGDFFS